MKNTKIFGYKIKRIGTLSMKTNPIDHSNLFNKCAMDQKIITVKRLLDYANINLIT